MIRDQKKTGNGSLDLTTTKKNVKSNEKRGKELNRAMNPQPSTSGSMQVDSSPIYNSTLSTDDSDFERKLPEKVKSSTKNK